MRIIAGINKGVVLKTFEADNVRPTIDRVKESVFNILQYEIPNSLVLDLFGGTGNLGLEAKSRGAKRVCVCDNNETSIKIIKANYTKCKQALELLECDFKTALKKLNGNKTVFDIVFLDPPYNTKYGLESIELISSLGLLSKFGCIVFEHGIETNIDSIVNKTNFIVDDTRKYGTVYVTFLKYRGTDL